jgi:ribosomal protein L40E
MQEEKKMAQFCRSCGSTLEEGAQFCRSCGATAVQPAQASQPMAQPVYTPPPYAAPYPPPAPQPVPQPAYYGNNVQQTVWPPVGVGEYIGMMLLTGIPLVGLILLISWAFGSQTNPSKRNYARAILIVMLIGVALSILLSATLIPLFANLFDSMQGTY